MTTTSGVNNRLADPVTSAVEQSTEAWRPKGISKASRRPPREKISANDCLPGCVSASLFTALLRIEPFSAAVCRKWLVTVHWPVNASALDRQLRHIHAYSAGATGVHTNIRVPFQLTNVQEAWRVARRRGNLRILIAASCLLKLSFPRGFGGSFSRIAIVRSRGKFRAIILLVTGDHLKNKLGEHDNNHAARRWHLNSVVLIYAFTFTALCCTSIMLRGTEQ